MVPSSPAGSRACTPKDFENMLLLHLLRNYLWSIYLLTLVLSATAVLNGQQTTDAREQRESDGRLDHVRHTSTSNTAPDLLHWSNPRIIIYPSLLSAQECDLVIETARNQSQYSHVSAGDVSVYLPVYPKLPPALQAIERRVSAVTGHPPHPDEEPMNIHHLKQKTATAVEKDIHTARTCLNSGRGPLSNSSSCGLSVQGVHHDKVQKEYSSVTVIVYLNDVDVGGGTVWPCPLTYDLSDKTNGALKQPAEYCTTAFNANARWYDGQHTVAYKRYSKHDSDPELQSQLREVLLAAHIGCLETAGNTMATTRCAK
jgi:hypothetical protein